MCIELASCDVRESPSQKSEYSNALAPELETPFNNATCMPISLSATARSHLLLFALQL